MNSKEKIASQMLQDLFTRPLLLLFLKEKFNIKLPKNAQFRDILKLIMEKNLEQDFCQAIFKEWELDVKVANFEEAYDFYKVGLCLSFFNVEQLTLMAEDFSRKRTKWTYKRNRGSLCQSIMNNVSIREIEEYIQRQIREKQIPPIQQSKFGWILGPMGLIKSTVARKPTKSEGMVKFLLRHVTYPSPYNELKDSLKDKLAEFTFNKRDPLLREKFCQLLLAKLSDEEIYDLCNQLIDKESLKIASVEKYWSITATPHGIFEPPYFGDENLAYWILRIFPKKDLLVDFPGGKVDNIEQLVREKCITETPDKILDRFFGSGPWLRKLAEKIDLVGLHRIESEKILRQSILLKLGFNVPPELEGIVNFASKLEKYHKDLESGLTLSVDKWNDVYSFLERILEDLALFYKKRNMCMVM